MSVERNFQVVGETLVKVRAGEHLSGVWRPSGQVTDVPAFVADKDLHLIDELGLSVGAIKVALTGNYEDVRIDAYGNKAAVDVGWNFAEARVNMQLIHYNPRLLELCMGESCGGWRMGPDENLNGVPSPGHTLGRGRKLYASGCHYMGLALWPATRPRFERDFADAGGAAVDGALDFAKSLVGSGAWYFWASYLTVNPVETPLGTEKSMIDLEWRALVYPHQHQALQGRGYSNPIPSPNTGHTATPMRLLSRKLPEEILHLTTELGLV